MLASGNEPLAAGRGPGRAAAARSWPAPAGRRGRRPGRARRPVVPRQRRGRRRRRRAGSSSWPSWPRCTTRRRWPPSPPCAGCGPTCRSSPASTPPSTPPCPPAAFTYAVPGATGACAATASTGCPTPTPPGGRRRCWAGRSDDAADWSPATWAPGASLCAVAGGVSVDTTMGYTPLEGLVMATRSGSVDPGARAGRPAPAGPVRRRDGGRPQPRLRAAGPGRHGGHARGAVPGRRRRAGAAGLALGGLPAPARGRRSRPWPPPWEASTRWSSPAASGRARPPSGGSGRRPGLAGPRPRPPDATGRAPATATSRLPEPRSAPWWSRPGRTSRWRGAAGAVLGGGLIAAQAAIAAASCYQARRRGLPSQRRAVSCGVAGRGARRAASRASRPPPRPRPARRCAGCARPSRTTTHTATRTISTTRTTPSSPRPRPEPTSGVPGAAVRRRAGPAPAPAPSSAPPRPPWPPAGAACPPGLLGLVRSPPALEGLADEAGCRARTRGCRCVATPPCWRIRPSWGRV